MKKLIIKVGGDMLEDMRKVFKDPSKAQPNTHTIYVKSPSEVNQLLSPQRIHLLKQLMEYEPTICGLALETNRKQEAISRDVLFLETNGLVKKRKEGREVFVEPQIDTIEIRFK